jgi:hypothetical protein
MFGELLLQVGADSDYVWELSDTLVLLSRASGAVFVSETTKATLWVALVDVALVLSI